MRFGQPTFLGRWNLDPLHSAMATRQFRASRLDAVERFMKAPDTPARSASCILLRAETHPSQGDTLFVADSKTSALQACALMPSTHQRQPGQRPRPLLGLTVLLTLLPIALRSQPLALEGIAARNGTDEVYLALSARVDRRPLIVMITGEDSAPLVDPGALSQSMASVADPIDADFMLWQGPRERRAHLVLRPRHGVDGRPPYAAGASEP
ncbi:MAG: hypothetical protein ACI9U2_004868 [Bradymonadia bacterium]|jgi:hypothetical protein